MTRMIPSESVKMTPRFYLLCYFSNNGVMIYDLGDSLGIILLFVMEDFDFRTIEKECFVIWDKVWREIIRISYLF